MSFDLQRRLLFGGIALAIFIPLVKMGGIPFQISVGLLAMLAVHEGASDSDLRGRIGYAGSFRLDPAT